MGIFVNQVGYYRKASKLAVLDFDAEEFQLMDLAGHICFEGSVRHFGIDEISAMDTYVADFTTFSTPGRYYIRADKEKSFEFVIDEHPYDALLEAVLKSYYFLRCGIDLEEKYAGKFVHGKCHCNECIVYDKKDTTKTVLGGWHDAGDFGRYVTAGATALAHLLFAYIMYEENAKILTNIPSDNDIKNLPDILAECKVELDWMINMQREDGAVYHKETSLAHSRFMMPEEDKLQMYLLPVSAIATADYAAAMAIAYKVYLSFDADYAESLLESALKAYDWLSENEEPLLFYNPTDCTTGEYDEEEDFSNRFFASAAMFYVLSEEKYFKDAIKWNIKLQNFAAQKYPKLSAASCRGVINTQLGYSYIGGLGSLCFMLADDERCLSEEEKEYVNGLRQDFETEALRLQNVMKTNGFGCAMSCEDFVWGSNQVLLKHAMVLLLADYKTGRFVNDALRQLDNLLGVNPLDFSYVTGFGTKSAKHPHLRQTACDGIDEVIKGFVVGGPNRNLDDPVAGELISKETPPMKCYLDELMAYSLNEITIYWNSPLVFLLIALKEIME